MKETEVTLINNDSSNRITGTIIHVNPKGFGFINSKSKPFTRIFFHWQALHHTIEFTQLKAGIKVSFELKKSDDSGFRAIKVELI